MTSPVKLIAIRIHDDPSPGNSARCLLLANSHVNWPDAGSRIARYYNFRTKEISGRSRGRRMGPRSAWRSPRPPASATAGRPDPRNVRGRLPAPGRHLASPARKSYSSSATSAGTRSPRSPAETRARCSAWISPERRPGKSNSRSFKRTGRGTRPRHPYFSFPGFRLSGAPERCICYSQNLINLGHPGYSYPAQEQT